jgi:hypothetical protein
MLDILKLTFGGVFFYVLGSSAKPIALFNTYEKSNIYMFKSRTISKYVEITIVIKHGYHAILE